MRWRTSESGPSQAVIHEYDVSNRTGTYSAGRFHGTVHTRGHDYRWLYRFPVPITVANGLYNFGTRSIDDRLGPHQLAIVAFRGFVDAEMTDQITSVELWPEDMRIRLTHSADEAWRRQRPDEFTVSLIDFYKRVHEVENCVIERVPGVFRLH